MGWADCGEDEDGRPIGYAFAATCDEEGCKSEIDRGLSYVCGHMHGGGAYGCGRYFCSRHLYYRSEAKEQLCRKCADRFEEEYGEEDDES